MRGVVRPSSLRVPVTRATKMPIVVDVEVFGVRLTVWVVLLADSVCRQLLVQVTVGTSRLLELASDSPPQIDWYARVCGVGASALMTSGGFTRFWIPGVTSKTPSFRLPTVVRTKP